jgi:SpoVK/Ycf46/Vps4 family AAA+-type ATPase
MVVTTRHQVSSDETFTDSSLMLSALQLALVRLDARLEQAIAIADQLYASGATADRYRGLYINRDEVDRLLNQFPVEPLFSTIDLEADSPWTVETLEFNPFTWLQSTYGLSDFDLDIILIALAPEIDRRYERLYAYLQDHVGLRLPGINLILDLLCTTSADKVNRRGHFTADAPLVRHGLIQLLPEPNHPDGGLLSQRVKPDPQVVSLLLGQLILDARLAGFCQWLEPVWKPDDSSMSTTFSPELFATVAQAWEGSSPLRFNFYGPSGVGKRTAAAMLAQSVGAPLLVVDLAQMLATESEPETLWLCVFREALFRDAILYLHPLEALLPPEQALHLQRLMAQLAADSGITIVAAAQPWIPSSETPLGLISVPFTRPDFGQRRRLWQQALDQTTLDLPMEIVEALAGRFRLTPRQIREAVATANQPGNQSGTDAAACFAAARQQSGQDLANLAHKLEPVYGWTDLVLPADTLTQLRELCQRVAHRHQVLEGWGFDRKLSLGKGVNALFAGPSGTGKTMAAEVIAKDLGLDLYRIDLSQVVSKYIGETEKNLNRIFQAAENANAILFFDEADALFGKRSQVRDSHDRYANIEISYLLQQMEAYEGLSILATNLNRNMDEAFLRRLTFRITFPLPEAAQRLQIWQQVWPNTTPLDGDVDLEFLAREFKVTGGNIKNMALTAAFLAVAEGRSVGMMHLLQATRREYQKLGKTLTAAELEDVWLQQRHPHKDQSSAEVTPRRGQES